MAAFRSTSELQAGTGCCLAMADPTPARMRSPSSSPAISESVPASASMKARHCGGHDRLAATTSVVPSTELCAGRPVMEVPIRKSLLVYRATQEQQKGPLIVLIGIIEVGSSADRSPVSYR